MAVLENYYFQKQYLKPACFNGSIWKVFVLKMVFGNSLFQWLYFKLLAPIVIFGKYLFERRNLETALLNDNNGKLVVWKMIFGNSLFQWQYLEINVTNRSFWKILVWKKVLENYFFEWQYLKITCLIKRYLGNNCLIDSISKLLVRCYLEINYLKECIWILVVWNRAFRNS